MDDNIQRGNEYLPKDKNPLVIPAKKKSPKKEIIEKGKTFIFIWTINNIKIPNEINNSSKLGARKIKVPVTYNRGQTIVLTIVPKNPNEEKLGTAP